MKKNIIILSFLLAFVANTEQGEEHNFSVGLHGAQALIGNYGLTFAFRLASHFELTVPLEFYSFGNSLPGFLSHKVADSLVPLAGVQRAPRLLMDHGRVGIGLRIFFTRSALSSGFYIEPLMYGGWMRHSDFQDVEFEDRREVLQAMAKTLYKKLPHTNRFVFSPQLNLGYQWISDSGFLFQLALFGNYVFAEDADTIFSASDRFFASSAVRSDAKSYWSHNAIEAFRAFGTQMGGWHAGGMINLGAAF